MSISKSTTTPYKGYEIKPEQGLKEFKKENKKKKKGIEGIRQDIEELHLKSLNTQSSSLVFVDLVVDYISKLMK
jgi:hypothetical protein